MASLKKPIVCTCGGTEFIHEFQPERWICTGCNVIAALRPARVTGVCRVCGVEKSTGVPFVQKGNMCRKCKSDYNKQYKAANHEELKQKHRESYIRDRKKRQAAVRISNSRSDEAWIKNLRRNLLKPSNRKKIKQGHSEAILIVQVDFDYLWAQFEKQDRVCAVTKLPMIHGPCSPRSMSVDRIDSALGYVPGNVQIVCKFVNLGKSNHTQDEVLEFFDNYYKMRLGS